MFEIKGSVFEGLPLPLRRLKEVFLSNLVFKAYTVDSETSTHWKLLWRMFLPCNSKNI